MRRLRCPTDQALLFCTLRVEGEQAIDFGSVAVAAFHFSAWRYAAKCVGGSTRFDRAEPVRLRLEDRRAQLQLRERVERPALAVVIEADEPACSGWEDRMTFSTSHCRWRQLVGTVGSSSRAISTVATAGTRVAIVSDGGRDDKRGSPRTATALCDRARSIPPISV